MFAGRLSRKNFGIGFLLIMLFSIVFFFVVAAPLVLQEQQTQLQAYQAVQQNNANDQQINQMIQQYGGQTSP